MTASVSSKAQQSGSVQKDKQMLDSLLASEHLDTLTGRPLTMYSHGYTKRAEAIQKMVRSCIEFYIGFFPDDNFQVSIHILNKTDWEKLPFPHPYGLPHFTDVNQSIIVSADKNALGKLNNSQSQDEDTDHVGGYDYVAVHELGHYFFFTLHNLDKEHWLNETLASYFLICWLSANHLPLDLGKPDADFVPKYKTLDDFEKLYVRVGPKNYDWYQRKFLQLDYSLYPSLKVGLIKDVLKNYSTGGNNLDALSLFKNLSREKMNDWLNGMR